MTDSSVLVAPRDITDLAVEAAIEAAAVILDVYARPIHVVSKSDGSPVTEADAAAEQVNIGLVEHGRPTMGVVLAPVTGEIFVGDANGAWTGRVVDGVVTEKRETKVGWLPRLRIVASRSHGHEALEKLCQTLDVESDVSVGSSLKFCLLARGDAQLYPRFTPTCEWDTAAGQAVLEAAGGAVVTLDGAPMRYGKHELSFLNPYFVAAASLELAQKAAKEMQALLE